MELVTLLRPRILNWRLDFLENLRAPGLVAVKPTQALATGGVVNTLLLV
jgi:hypothetical protein